MFFTDVLTAFFSPLQSNYRETIYLHKNATFWLSIRVDKHYSDRTEMLFLVNPPRHKNVSQISQSRQRTPTLTLKLTWTFFAYFCCVISFFSFRSRKFGYLFGVFILAKYYGVWTQASLFLQVFFIMYIFSFLNHTLYPSGAHADKSRKALGEQEKSL